MFLSSFGFQGSTQKKVVVVLELRDREEFGETKPALVLMLENGHCVALVGPSPIITYYPDWSGLQFFTGATLPLYEASDPADYELPDEWDTGSTPLGPVR